MIPVYYKLVLLMHELPLPVPIEGLKRQEIDKDKLLKFLDRKNLKSVRAQIEKSVDSADPFEGLKFR